MNFKESKNYLQKIFTQNSFIEDVKANKKHTHQVVVETCSNGTEILVSFPGYKSKSNYGRIVYDYRVDISKEGETTALSHTNIIADIYNKIVNGNMSADKLKAVLIDISQEGNIDIQDIERKLPYNSINPTMNFIQKIKKAHGNKFYNETGNSFDLTIEELIKSIKWIVLQEDINYPIPRFEGRKMPFARYIETIFITQNNSHTLEEVISRALSHSRPMQWTEMDYSFRNNIR